MEKLEDEFVRHVRIVTSQSGTGTYSAHVKWVDEHGQELPHAGQTEYSDISEADAVTHALRRLARYMPAPSPDVQASV